MTLSNEGNKGGKGIEPGDLLIYFEEKEHPYFIRNGLDLFVEAEVPVYLAALGGKIDLPTIGGKASLKIPSGIQSGQILRMRGKCAQTKEGCSQLFKTPKNEICPSLGV